MNRESHDTPATRGDGGATQDPLDEDRPEGRDGRSPSNKTVTTYLAFLGILLAFGIDVSLPAFDEIRADLDPGSRPISLVVTSYVLGLALGQLAWGAVSDRLGRRPAMVAGLLCYVVAGIASALAPSFTALLIARAAWGLGAAAPGGLRIAIARDLYSGDEMARVVTIVMAVFMIGPIFVPAIGEGLLAVGPWPIVFYASAALGAVALVWTWRFGETLPPERRSTSGLASITAAGRAVFTTRRTIGLIAAQTFSGAAFFIFLGSSQPIIDRIYGRADQFALLFGGAGVVMVGALLVVQRAIAVVGARRTATALVTGQVVASAAGVALALAGSGRPSLWAWFAWVTVTNALLTTFSPVASSLAMEPMGDQAGMASSVLGAITFAGGALMAAVVDARIDTTITPMTVGYLVFTIGAAACFHLTMAGEPHAVRPASSGPVHDRTG